MNLQISGDHFLVGRESTLCSLAIDQQSLRVERVMVEGQGYLVIRGSLAEINPIVTFIVANWSGSVCCLMDRVFFLYDSDGLGAVGIAFFETVAREYETLVSERRNARCAQQLLSLAANIRGLSVLQRVLDFGCGTGLSTKALKEMFASVVGYDGSAAMRELARGAGSVVVDSMDQCPSASIDIVVACYVMHFGIHESDANELYRILTPGGIIAANFHKRIALATVTKRLEQAGFSLSQVIDNSACEFGPIVLFHRNQ